MPEEKQTTAQQRRKSFEERKQQRIEVAALPGTTVFQPRTSMAHTLIAYQRNLDRCLYALQNQLSQPGYDEAKTIAMIKKVKAHCEATRALVVELCDVAGVRFIDPERNLATSKEKKAEKA